MAEKSWTQKENHTFPVTLKHPDGLVHVKPSQTSGYKVSVELFNPELCISKKEWETLYPLGLIEKILNVKGPQWLCDEIMRDEDPKYVQHNLKYSILSYVSEESFRNKRVLDFGCGAGSSTMILSRMFPHTEIVGVELEDRLLCVAKLRSQHYKCNNVRFTLSPPSGENLPNGLGDFDYVILSGVYEHLLPNERKTLLPKIWLHIKPGGILFINQTPHRYFPIDFHTTGLPFINYLPDKIAFQVVKRFSKKVRPEETWNTLLRRGIRGGTDREILHILNTTSQKPILLEPERMGIRNRIELWHSLSSPRLFAVKKALLICLKAFKSITGITFTQHIDLAIKKSH
jgi:2-polyprenyl-3-methyl-5-hydroxy-6-metoxy-1,4-benzoquinol methylase